MNALINNSQSVNEAMFQALTADYEQMNQMDLFIEQQLNDQSASSLNLETVPLDPVALGQRLLENIDSACDQNSDNCICVTFQALAEMCDWKYIGQRLLEWHKVRAPWYYEN